MADKNKIIAEEVLAAVGGTANIVSVTHCMTRLRFVLKDQSVPDKKKLESIKGVMGTNIAGGQYQVIIGNSVGNVYKELVAVSGVSDTTADYKADQEKQKVNPVVAALDFIAGCMTPLFTAIIAGGLIKVLLVIFGPTLLGVLSSESDTYILMNALGDAPFYFLPVLVAFTASKKLNCNSFLAVMVSSVLIYPDVITLLGSDQATHLFGVIPVVHGSYSSSIIPAMLATILLKYVEIIVDKIVPDWSKNFLKPLLIVIITAPITLCLLAPLGLMVGNGLQFVINAIYNFAPWLAMMLFSAAMPFIVMTGMHWAFVPACLLGLASPGYDLLLLPAMLASNIAQAGATFGVAAKTKDNELREMAIPAGVSALLAGVTEPAMYGITLRLRKPMIAACIASGIGGLIMGITSLKAYAFATPCLTAIVQFIAPDSGKNMICAVVVLVVSLVLSFVLSFIMTKNEGIEEQSEEKTPAESIAKNNVQMETVKAEASGEEAREPEKDEEQRAGMVTEITAPIKGEVIPLTEVKDPTFAAGILGEGFAVVPAEGKVYAPFDGTCDNIFDTLHAMGLTSDRGVELLIHVGLETVNLNGAPFTAHVENGQHFKKGDLLLEFDIEAIQKAGCEIQTPVIVTNTDEYEHLTVEKDRIVIGG